MAVHDTRQKMIARNHMVCFPRYAAFFARFALLPRTWLGALPALARSNTKRA